VSVPRADFSKKCAMFHWSEYGTSTPYRRMSHAGAQAEATAAHAAACPKAFAAPLFTMKPARTLC
jgi:hypothetical protein